MTDDEYVSDETWSKDVAELAIDALVDAKLIPRAKVQEAIKILTTEILVHLSLDRPAPETPPAPNKDKKAAEKAVPKDNPYYVSIWVGTAKSKKDLDDYLAIKYDEDDEKIPSPFMKDFGIKHYDDDFREAAVADAPTASISGLLKEHSEGEKLVPATEKKLGKQLPEPANVTLLLYDFNYESTKAPSKAGKVNLRFLASIVIDHEGPRA